MKTRKCELIEDVFLRSGFSTEVVFYTMGTLPALPLAPRLVRAGVSWVTLEWGRPEGSPSEEQLKYTLEIQEDNSVSTTKHTHRCLFHLAAYQIQKI